MAALEIRGLGKRFGSVQALHDISLSVGADELCVILGPTGAGKTTLLRLLAGLEHPDAGTIHLAGEDVTGWAPAARDVALVFQNFSLYPGWSVRRNLEFPLQAPGRGLAAREIAGRVAEAATLLHIEHLLDREAEQLSGGEMQRVAIGRAIVRRPRLILMDEPLSNLDAKLREELRVELVALRRSLGAPMVYVTHDQAEAMSMADCMAVLAQGRLLQQGTPVELYERPLSPAVAQQLGQRVNVLRVAVSEGKVTLADARGDAGIVLSEHVNEPPSRPECLLGVRPEDIEARGGARPARAVVVEDSGPHLVVLADWAGVRIHLICSKGADAPAPGDTLFPRVRMDRAVWWELPKEDGAGAAPTNQPGGE